MGDVLMDGVLIDDFLQSLTIDQLEGEALELARVLGMDAFRKLIAIYGGSGCLYVPSLSKLRAEARKQKLLHEYHDGARIKHLARKYHLSERYVYDIIHQERKNAHREDTG